MGARGERPFPIIGDSRPSSIRAVGAITHIHERHTLKYFTSDLHFHHPFVAALRGYAKEGFKSDATIREQAKKADTPLDEAVDWESHDKAVCKNIRATLGKGDDLYILGDVSSGSRGSFDAAMETLKGLRIDRTHMHLVLGNHEDLRMHQGQMKALLDVFADVSVRSVVTIHGRNLAMSHFQFSDHFDEPPLPGMPKNMSARQYKPYAVADDGETLLLHGHTHAKEMFEFGNPRELNIGLDAWDMKPVSEEQVANALGIDRPSGPQKPMDEEEFTRVARGFLRASYEDKSRPVRQRREEYDAKADAIVNSDSGSVSERAGMIRDLSSQYSRVVMRFDPDGDDAWVDDACGRLMDRCKAETGDHPVFSDVRRADALLTAVVEGPRSRKAVKVTVVSATSKVMAHAVVSFSDCDE